MWSQGSNWLPGSAWSALPYWANSPTLYKKAFLSQITLHCQELISIVCLLFLNSKMEILVYVLNVTLKNHMWKFITCDKCTLLEELVGERERAEHNKRRWRCPTRDSQTWQRTPVCLYTQEAGARGSLVTSHPGLATMATMPGHFYLYKHTAVSWLFPWNNGHLNSSHWP